MQLYANQAHTETETLTIKGRTRCKLSGINMKWNYFFLEYYKCVSRPKWNKNNLKLLLGINAELDSSALHKLTDT